MLEHSNHKSPNQEAANLWKLIWDEVEHTFTLPLPLACTHLLGATLIAPLGLIQQNTINDKGQPTTKY